MERWRKHAIEQTERDKHRTDELIEYYTKQAKTAPKLVVDEDGIHRPRRWNECMARTYTALSEAAQMTIDQLENGSKP